jgi:hypothetical protein
MKPPPGEKVMINFNRLPDGEVVADVLDEQGTVLETRSFGRCSCDDYRLLVDVINQELPALGAMAVRVNGN